MLCNAKAVIISLRCVLSGVQALLSCYLFDMLCFFCSLTLFCRESVCLRISLFISTLFTILLAIRYVPFAICDCVIIVLYGVCIYVLVLYMRVWMHACSSFHKLCQSHALSPLIKFNSIACIYCYLLACLFAYVSITQFELSFTFYVLIAFVLVAGNVR